MSDESAELWREIRRIDVKSELATANLSSHQEQCEIQYANFSKTMVDFKDSTKEQIGEIKKIIAWAGAGSFATLCVIAWAFIKAAFHI